MFSLWFFLVLQKCKAAPIVLLTKELSSQLFCKANLDGRQPQQDSFQENETVESVSSDLPFMVTDLIFNEPKIVCNIWLPRSC